MLQRPANRVGFPSQSRRKNDALLNGEKMSQRSKNLPHGSAFAEKRGLESEAPMVSDAFQTSGNSPTHSEKIQPDFTAENHGSIFLLKLLTPSAISRTEEHIGQDYG